MYGTEEKSASESMKVTKRVPLPINELSVGHSVYVKEDALGEYDKSLRPVDSNTESNDEGEIPSELTIKRLTTVVQNLFLVKGVGNKLSSTTYHHSGCYPSTS